MIEDDVKDAPNRVDGFEKVTGKAKFIAEFKFPNLAYGFMVVSTIAKGKIRTIDTAEAEKQKGVVKILTHLNTPKYPPGERDKMHRPLQNADILFNGQVIAVVVADSLEEARFAASLVRVDYEKQTSETDMRKVLDKAIAGRPRPARGNPQEAFEKAEFKIEAEYTIPIEHHNAMEPHASVAKWEGDKLKIYDKTQGVTGVRSHLAGIFKIPNENVTVLAPFIGGAFGASLRPSPNTFLSALAAKETNRPVSLVYTRRQSAVSYGYRPCSIQKIRIAAEKSGKLTAILHESVNNTSAYDDFSEGMVNVSRSMYACPNVFTEGKIARIDLQTPIWMRAPGTVSGMFALESALDELAYKLKIDPLEMRLVNYAETDPESGKPFSSKELRKCYAEGAKKFGWEKRPIEPRSMKKGNWLIGWGMATGTWGAGQAPASARVTINQDGSVLVESGTTDIGPGTYTTMAIIAAKNLGVPVEKVKFVLGDSNLPQAPSQGGSITTASVGTAVQDCSQVVLKKLFDLAKFEGVAFEDVKAENGGFTAKNGKKITFVEILKQNNLAKLSETHTSNPNTGERSKYAIASHGAQFVEVMVDEELGIVKVPRLVEVTAAGKIVNLKNAHNQEIGGMVWGIGMALTEETLIDHRYGKIMNPNLAGYHVPTNADVLDMDTNFVEEIDTIINPLGVKGLGELGLVGIPPAIANAIFHATGKRFRELPITPDKFL